MRSNRAPLGMRSAAWLALSSFSACSSVQHSPSEPSRAVDSQEPVVSGVDAPIPPRVTGRAPASSADDAAQEVSKGLPAIYAKMLRRGWSLYGSDGQVIKDLSKYQGGKQLGLLTDGDDSISGKTYFISFRQVAVEKDEVAWQVRVHPRATPAQIEKKQLPAASYSSLFTIRADEDHPQEVAKRLSRLQTVALSKMDLKPQIHEAGLGNTLLVLIAIFAIPFLMNKAYQSGSKPSSPSSPSKPAPLKPFTPQKTVIGAVGLIAGAATILMALYLLFSLKGTTEQVQE